MFFAFVVGLVILILPAASFGEEPWDWELVNRTMVCQRNAQTGKECGYMLTNAGWWDELSRCSDGYHWSYILENFSSETKGARVLCAGISKSNSFEEISCVPWMGDLARFNAVGAAMKSATQKPSVKNLRCFTGFGQNIKMDIKPSSIGQRIPKVRKETKQELWCKITQCKDDKGNNCGCELIKKGWKEIARCDGHQWSYVLESNKRRVLCRGIAAHGGPEEDPCVVFTGKLEEFKKCKP